MSTELRSVSFFRGQTEKIVRTPWHSIIVVITCIFSVNLKKIDCLVFNPPKQSQHSKNTGISC